MTITQNQDITSLTTFGIPVRARYFAEYSDDKELLKLSRSDEFIYNEVLHIGGGSNLLFINDFDGLVLHSRIMGKQIYRKNEDTVFAIVGAGEKWTDFVDWAVENDLQGVENLAGIPGEVGASPVQNVGAYGMEAGDAIHAVECFDTVTREKVTFRREDCKFGYRDSFFKHEGRGRYFVLRVSFRLVPGGEPTRLDYGPLRSLAEKKARGERVTLREVADMVVATRDSKLPDPRVLGSAGSFFKNPIVNKYFYEQEIKPHFPDMPVYEGRPEIGEGRVKLSAGWMIDHAGLKGLTVGGASVYQKQALVIVNDGGASAADVVGLAERVRREVRHRYRVEIRPEVNYIYSGMKVTVLGSGTSKGVPEIGCLCDVCLSQDRHDKRTRASVLVQTHGLDILIDASPDLRQQSLSLGLDHLDAMLITHSHYDHVGGLDDIRPFQVDHTIPIYVREDVDRDIRKRLDYCFRESLYPGVPVMDLHVIGDQPFMIDNVQVMPIKVWHGRLPIFGYRIDDFAYITDAKSIDESEKEKLYGLKVLIVNALRPQPHFAHFSLDEALALIDELKPEQAYLTHFSHDMPANADLESLLPPNVHPAYDGLVIDC